MRMPFSHSMVKMKNMARSPYLHPRRMRRGVRQSARGQPERHGSARDPQRADLEGRSRTWDGLDSGIPAGRAAFTVLKSAYVNRMRSELDDVDLKSFGLVTEGDTLTNAGALLADQPLVRCSRVFCTRFTGEHENDFADTAEYEGSLLALLRETQAFVKRHTAESWEKTSNSRIERRSHSERAVEETLVNALIHRSYLELGSEVHVDMYNDCMKVRSPSGQIGVSLPDNVIKNRVRSERRNPIIADVFDRMSLMERRGSGLREICTATASEDAYRPEFMPRFETGENWFTVTLYNMNYVEADTVGTQVGTPSCNIMPGISTSFFDALAC